MLIPRCNQHGCPVNECFSRHWPKAYRDEDTTGRWSDVRAPRTRYEQEAVAANGYVRHRDGRGRFAPAPRPGRRRDERGRFI